MTLNDQIACVRHTPGTSRTVAGDGDEIVVPLVTLTVWKTSGVTVTPASRDLQCSLNGEVIDVEANIIPGKVHNC